MFSFFKKKTAVSSKPKTAAFVDFEHWYISLDRNFHIRPNIKAWRDELARQFEISEIIFFGDFSNPSLRAEIPKIREVTNYIIETQNASPHHKKDYTDFIMLDHIYQKAITARDIDTYIIFSGDGHFSSAASFLITQCGKQVGVYAVKDSLSSQLSNTASWVVEVPQEDTKLFGCYHLILRNIKQLEEKSTQNKKYRPTFWGTADAVAKYNDLDRETVADAIRSLIEKGYLYQESEQINSKRFVSVKRGNKKERISKETVKNVKVLYADWDKLRRDRLWQK